MKPLRRFVGAHKWKMLLYVFFVIGFVDMHYQELNALIRSMSSPAAQTPLHQYVRRSVEGTLGIERHSLADADKRAPEPREQRKRLRLVRRTTAEWSTLTTEQPIVCEFSANCNQGTCVAAADNVSYCECDDGYLSLDAEGNPSLVPCDYKQVSKLALFLISFFVGICGVDWVWVVLTSPSASLPRAMAATFALALPKA